MYRTLERLRKEGIAPRIRRDGCIVSMDDRVESECSALEAVDVVFWCLER